ncbi:transcriptional regulator [uncultured Corynebacterium sp.]|uniref:transcriptional regulator n=1 Tax=uncultured Corynebacterium sp. TaxID=159447 RepID=UPI00341A2BAC
MLKACFNDTIHSPLRLRTCGLLRNVDQVDFSRLGDFLNISDATLSKHLKVLVEAGFLVADKEASLTLAFR